MDKIKIWIGVEGLLRKGWIKKFWRREIRRSKRSGDNEDWRKSYGNYEGNGGDLDLRLSVLEKIRKRKVGGR